jgi:ubiquinone/menaquinone biosynthesis C-methylase UbiE
MPDVLDWSEDVPLSEKHVKIFETCNKYEAHLTKAHFDFIAANYEGMYEKMGYPDPKYVAKYIHKQAKKNGQNPEDVKVLDLGCGSGLVGKNLATHGFKNIVGLDISPNMLEEASKKGVYSELHEHTLNNPEDFPNTLRAKFDYVACSGLINNNYMDYLLFEEMLLAVKKGGSVVFAARYSFMGHYWYDKIIKELADNGRWKLIATDTFFKYDQLACVSIGRFSKTPSKVFVFEKIQDDLSTHVRPDDQQMMNFLRSKTSVKDSDDE